jgi:DNA-binding response OmpR family regulator
MYIAILEDDPGQAKLMTMWLERAGHACKTFPTGKEFIDHVTNERFSLLILDWELPDIKGDAVLQWVRENIGWEIPVLFMTFRDSSEEVASILKLGADDFVSKSVKKDELLARIDSLERRATISNQKQSVLRVGEFVIDAGEHRVTRHGEEIKLTPTELKLALYLFQTMDKLRTRSDLLANVWGRNAEISTRTVDIHISRLRKKLELTPEHGWLLESVSGVGYRLVRLPQK